MSITREHAEALSKVLGILDSLPAEVRAWVCASIAPGANGRSAPGAAAAQKGAVRQAQRQSARVSEYSPEFLSLWFEYPKKLDKQDAYISYQKLKPSQELQERMLLAVRQQRDSEDWQKDNGRFIPYLKTWLNGRRWEDEPKAQTQAQRRLSQKGQRNLEAAQRWIEQTGKNSPRP